jgi:hypothetical protein
LIDRDQLFQTVDLHQLIDVGIRIGIRRWVLILHLGDQESEKIIGGYGCVGIG